MGRLRKENSKKKKSTICTKKLAIKTKIIKKRGQKVLVQ